MKKCNQCKVQAIFENELICGRCETLNRLIKERKEKEQAKQIKIEAELKLKEILALAKIRTYTATSSQLEPYIKSYGQALKEIWSKPITDRIEDYRILEKHGLGRVNRYFGITISAQQHWDWDYQLKNINEQIFRLKIG